VAKTTYRKRTTALVHRISTRHPFQPLHSIASALALVRVSVIARRRCRPNARRRIGRSLAVTISRQSVTVVAHPQPYVHTSLHRCSYVNIVSGHNCLFLTNVIGSLHSPFLSVYPATVVFKRFYYCFWLIYTYLFVYLLCKQNYNSFTFNHLLFIFNIPVIYFIV
jgi:hypothetical protein